MWTLAQVFAEDWHVELTRHIPALVLRSLITFGLVLITVRWTGKRTVANLAPFDLALVILIGEVAAIPVADLKVEMLHGIIPVLLIGALHVVMTTISMHSRRFEEWVEGKPTLLVKDGQVLKKNLLKERVSLVDLRSALRHKDVPRIELVKEAWMEPAGGVSVILRETESPASTKELRQAIEEIVQANSARMRQELERLLEVQEGESGG